MKITQIFQENKPPSPFEAFPPKPNYPIETITGLWKNWGPGA